MNILLIGSGTREHALARAITRSRHAPALYCFGTARNPGISALTQEYRVGAMDDMFEIVKFARTYQIDIVVVGPEAPLAAGVVDELATYDISAIGPTKQLAQLETSKSFTRNLLVEYDIQAYPQFKYFTSSAGVRQFIEELEGNYVVKVDGLAGGKGVKVSGDHLHSIDEGVAWCDELTKQGKPFLIEEKLIGQEFSFFSFSDGANLAHMPPVQDHKRAFVGDTGPNTGGMGSYSGANHLLPFLTENDIAQAKEVNQSVIDALRDKFDTGYKGILYGGFIATSDGIKLIEYNARFGDPEAMNLLTLLESDFVDICIAIVEGNLTQEHARFARRASVFKYAVPEGYPDNPVKDQEVDVNGVQNKEHLFYGSVDEVDGKLLEKGSRTAGVIGVAGTIREAEKIAEEEINRISGPLYHREDIGTEELIKQRISMMSELRSG